MDLPNNYKHLEITRTEPINERRPRKGYGSNRIPKDPVAFAQSLQKSIEAVKHQASAIQTGYDKRFLIKIETESQFVPDELTKITRDVEIVAQETKGVVIAFATEAALAEFESRLTSIVAGEKPTYQNVIFALDGFSVLSPEERTGNSLKGRQLDTDEELIVDVEMFPSESPRQRAALTAAFERFCDEQSIAVIDRLVDVTLILYRLRVKGDQLNAILAYRDVRKADLPPDYSLPANFGRFDINDVPEIQSPSLEAPTIAVLDTGVESGHPLLKAAIGESAVFCSSDGSVGAQDDHGHGTEVAGIALYRDIEACLTNGTFQPEFWLVSGRVLDGRAEYYAPTWEWSSKTTLIENDVAKAVAYFKETRNCAIYNLSFGDINRIYAGGRPEGLAVRLDTLAREQNVLFIISTGNRIDELPASYPADMFVDNGRLLDPATALNGVTVGSVARYDRSADARRNFPVNLTDVPVARHGEPAPVTRVGPGPRGALKPDFVEFGSNWSAGSTGNLVKRGLGILTTAFTSQSFTGLIGEAHGTSFSAPGVSHLAAKVKMELPGASAMLIRAILACHAHIPDETVSMGLDEDRLRRIAGYGKIDDIAVSNSKSSDVTMFAEDQIQNDRVHFYELPIPDEFLSAGKRDRHITVSLSYFPPVRSTRVDYLASKLSFHLIKGDINEAFRTFNAAVARDEVEDMAEYTNGRTVTHQLRSKGTLQMSRWDFKIGRGNREMPKFVVVVTRNDPAWGESLASAFERYALAVRVSDRANTTANLFVAIRNLLRVRPRARA